MQKLFLAAFSLLVILGVQYSYAQEDQSIVINASKATYVPGETVYLNGTVSGGTAGQLVAIQVKDSKGALILIRTVQADQNGNFALSFKMPVTSPAGGLDVTASARISGFVITQDKVTAGSTVPEFPPQAPILAAGIVTLLAFYGAVLAKNKNRTGMLPF